MKKYLILCVLLAAYFGALAQSVVSSSGGNYENESGSAVITIGEPMIQTLTTEELILTQGFNQGVINITSLWEKKDNQIQIEVFPNPAVDIVNISCSSFLEEKLLYTLFNGEGKAILSNVILEKEFNIQFSQLKPAIYILKIYSQDALLKTLKIVKN